jgi:hypothetical protein
MLGCELHDDGSIAVDSGQATTIDRIYAAGNCAEPRALVPAAAGSGVTAAVAINTRLSFEDADRAVADSRAAASASEVRWPAPSPGGMSLESTRAPRRRTRGALTTEVGVSGAV